MPAAIAHFVTLIETYHALGKGNESVFKVNPRKKKRLRKLKARLGEKKSDQWISQYAYLGSVFPDVPYYNPDVTGFASDLFHYNKSGTFAIKLIDYAKGKGVGSDSGNKLMAFILGFISHIACDVVCHPYINTIAGAYWNQLITFIDYSQLPFLHEIPIISPLIIRPITNRMRIAAVHMHMMTECHQDSWLAKEYFGLDDLSSEGLTKSWSGFIDELEEDDMKAFYRDVRSCFTKVYGKKLDQDPLWTAHDRVFEMLDGSYDRALFAFPDEPSENLVDYRHRDHDYYDYLKRAFTLSQALCKLAIDYYKAPEPGTSQKDTLKEYLKDWNLDMGYRINVDAEKKNGKIESIHIRYEHSWCHDYGLYGLKAKVTEKKEILPDACRKESIVWSNVRKEVAAILSQSDSMSDLMKRINPRKGNLDILSAEIPSAAHGELGKTGRSPRGLKNQALVCFQFAWSKIESRFHMASIMAHEYEHARQALDRKFTTAEAAPFLTSDQYIVLRWSSEYKAFDFQAKVLKEIAEEVRDESGALAFKPCHEALLARDRRLRLLTEGKVKEARSEIVKDYDVWKLGGEHAIHSKDRVAMKFVEADVKNFLKTAEWKKQEAIWKPYLP